MPSTVVDSPIGPLGLIASEAGLQSVLFDGGGISPDGSSPVLVEAVRQLDAYFDGDLVTFDLPLELNGTEFNRRCWLALATIPYGQTVSYGEQARRLGLGSDAARAVGAANGRNPLPIVLPCHRVIGSDGSRPTSTRLGGARQPANPPTPSLRPFNQARSGPLGIRQEKRQKRVRNAT